MTARRDEADGFERLDRLLRDGPEAEEAVALLLADPLLAIAPLRAVLTGSDARRKAAAIERVVAKLPADVAIELAPELLALAMNPSEADLEAEVDELAEAALARWL